ncbi:MAG: Spx/MgsR family RNA polymerase-binding regulatory protein [Sphingobacteriales bacterium]|nr:MAG: Spx/MgsR family RNA polymerase-binding regulatory protein [Sphingobacteriales bacterium]
MQPIVYGIPNCDTIKKTLEWFRKQAIEVSFHNYKKEGITKTLLSEWIKQVGWEVLLNKKGTTWKQLSPEEQAAATDAEAVVALLAAHTSMIKRPVITFDGQVFAVGFNEPALLDLAGKCK